MPRLEAGEPSLAGLEWPAPAGRPTLVFIHGAGGDHTIWAEQIAAFRGRAGILAPDLPGHGRSTAPREESIAALARLIGSLIARKRIPLPVLVGHSMGGAVALEAALAGQAAGLVLAGTSARLAVSQKILDLLRVDAGEAVRRIARYAYAPGAPEPLVQKGIEHLSRSDPATLLADFEACNAFDARERLGALRVPALVVCGTADRLTFPEQAEWMAARISGAEYRPVTGAGHLLMIERPEEFNAIVADWLRARFPRAFPG